MINRKGDKEPLPSPYASFPGVQKGFQGYGD